MSLTELLMQAKAKKAQEFLFIVGGEPRARTPVGWESLRSSPGLVTEWNLLQQSFLDSPQRAALEASGMVEGESNFENLRVGFSFFQQNSIMKAVLTLDVDGAKQDFQIPASVTETCLQMKGLVILSGPGESGQTTTLQSIAQKLSQEKSFLGVIFSPKTFPQIQESRGTFIYHSGHFAHPDERENLLSGADMVVFDGVAHDHIFLQASTVLECSIL